jgi:hypothetical protein
METESSAVSVQATQVTVAPVRLAARRLGDFGWFLSHLVAVAMLTAVGAVVVLAAVTLLCVAAPVAAVGLVSVMHRRDARLHGQPDQLRLT